MTSGTNILSVSEKLQLPLVPGVSAVLSKLSIPSCSSWWEKHTWEFQLSFSSWSPCGDPGDTAGDRLVTGQCTVWPLCRDGAVNQVCSHCGSQFTPGQPCGHQLSKTMALDVQSLHGWQVGFPSRRENLSLTNLIYLYGNPLV